MISDLVNALAVEVAVLAELADELEADGQTAHAKRIRSAIDVADGALDPLDKVKEIVVLLRHVDYALEKGKYSDISMGIRRIRRRLTHEANKLLPDTLRVRATGEYLIPDETKKS